ncbi:uncharacterized protein C11orf24 homolog isoform X1 [Marmota marmota marmota]|uniref:uncharacterized protein C11orf24 homolog isoform X1 n=2 Tax=Marmota marmota marmota TaxID=9994 RepID=UPI0007625626|nr:uncharacterized protein C11orf24 homolog isoform X1 [Marmota marmota marmota]XP_048663734.1 uncharacterized protein C11orf24 homolog isoform X1 [Marmota marmota marmota]
MLSKWGRDPSAKQKATADSLRASGTALPCSDSPKMWTALMLVWLSSLSLFGSQVASQEPGSLIPNKTENVLVKKNASLDADDKTTTVTHAPVMLTQATVAAKLTFAPASAETTQKTNVSTPAAAPPSPIPTSVQWTPSTAAAGPPSPSSPLAGGPPSPGSPLAGGPPSPGSPLSGGPTSPSSLLTGGPRGSALPGAAAVATEATRALAATATSTSRPSSTLHPAEHMPHSSTASPAPPARPQAQDPTVRVLPSQPVLNTTGWSTRPPDTTPEPTTTHSETPVSSTVETVVSLTAVTATQVRAEKPTANTVPVPHTSPTPEVEATSPTTQPSRSSPTQGASGPGTLQTLEQVKTKTTPGAASTGPTPTDMCPLSTQGQYLVVTTEPLTPSLVNKTFLLAVLVLGVTLFITVLVLFALQAYESYKKKDYTQVDYLINGMYADSEM